MRKIILLILIIMGLLALIPQTEVISSTQSMNRIGTAESDGGG